MPTTAIATAADYADALITARRTKNTLVLLLVVMLLAQIALFFIARQTRMFASSTASTQPASTTDLLHYVDGLCIFFGMTLAIVLSFVLLLIVNIMLVGRLIGAGRLTGAYVLCLVLMVMMFPWQAFLRNAEMSNREFIVPGVLYTWDELRSGAQFDGSNWNIAALKWARFVGFPVVALLLLFTVQVKSNRGLRQALGEDELIPTAPPRAVRREEK